MKKGIVTVIMAILAATSLMASEGFVSFRKAAGMFPVASEGRTAGIYFDKADHEGIRMAALDLIEDIGKVCGAKPAMLDGLEGECIIIGSLSSPVIRRLAEAGTIDLNALEGRNEKYILKVVKRPLPGVKKALIIAGSDKRGTIYGIYELSRQIGVSPWHWWMDVPVARHEDIYIKNGIYTDGEPKVAYRGIFINDEWPSFGSWAMEKFGGINSRCYEHIFELLLRLKGNFMWPAMWASAFYDDDPLNGTLADRMGIVMGTSHHEPMALAQQDWKRRGEGAWNYVTNTDAMRRFWTSGIERCKDWETFVTVGMRGDGDEAMEDSGNIALMERIVRDQREIISSVTGKPAEETPQVWALYKEVQDYYDKGMQVPDDVTLMLCDDNWGNVRRLPAQDAKPRKGGYGMYYHFDYVGAPRNSKWVNISPIPRIWEQMNLTYAHGVDKIWIVNVGDLKPMEYPITFFLDMAWDPERFNPDNLIQHSVDFCASIFGETHAKEAARLLRTYAKFNRRMAPELLDSRTYSMNYGEWERVTAEYGRLALDAAELAEKLPQQYQDAYFQLIGYPVYACANLYDMYYAQAMNAELAERNDPEANLWADRVEECFIRDSLLTEEYHRMAGGKWNHMMDQIHIGYTYWNQPEERTMPRVRRVEEEMADVTIKLPSYEAPHMSGTASGPYVFEERDGYVSIEAEHYTRSSDGPQAQWCIIPELGRTLSGITPQPATASTEGMWLEYDMELATEGPVEVVLRFSPTLNYNVDGLRYAVSFDGGEEQTMNINGHYDGEIGEWQRLHVIDCTTEHHMTAPGMHTLRIRPLDNGLVLQKVMVNTGGLRESLLGPPETLKNRAN